MTWKLFDKLNANVSTPKIITPLPSMDKDWMQTLWDNVFVFFEEKEMRYSHHRHNEQLWSHSGLILVCWNVYDFWTSDTTFERMFHELIWGTYCKWQVQAILFNNIVGFKDQYSLHELHMININTKQIKRHTENHYTYHASSRRAIIPPGFWNGKWIRKRVIKINP